ncbi:type I secretion system permease/ATPase [Thiorhodococcus fuscus]|uniref:Type I secretion system permease/ATPase n=1 Tax=Thiorhodococcus fuscus TaxID=527200 RepID=A0ABW4YE37_9GAMM
MKSDLEIEFNQLPKSLSAGFGAVGIFSFLIALGALVPAVYMLQVMDRVLNSRSEPTLYALTGLTLFIIFLIGVMMFARARLMARLANKFDDKIGPRIFELIFRIGLEQPAKTSLQPFEDLITIRNFLAGSTLIALMDAPFIPLFLIALYLIHPWIGITVLVFGVMNGILALINSSRTRKAIREAQQEGRKSRDFMLNSLRNADAVQSMGMIESLRLRWLHNHLGESAEQSRSSDISSIYSTASRSLSSMARIVTMAVAAYLILKLELSPGAMIASLILSGRALGPLQTLIASWPQMTESRLAYQRLRELLQQFPARERQIRLPEPEGEVRVEGVFAGPGHQRGTGDPPILRGISLIIKPGETLAILGPSGSGKTTLARIILGLWPTLSGRVRLDGADVRHWDPLQFGRYVGYLPQDVQLFPGSIADNIARFGRIRSEKVVTAAKLAGVHQVILNLGKGYLTEVGPGGLMLSAGQRQRIGLARALYDLPKLVVMDEPNSNLDEEGHAALMQAVDALKERGSSVIFISHRRSILSKADKVFVIHNGQSRFFGTRSEFYANFAGNNDPGADGVDLSGRPVLEQQTPLAALSSENIRVKLPNPEPIDDYDLGAALTQWRPIRVS